MCVPPRHMFNRLIYSKIQPVPLHRFCCFTTFATSASGTDTELVADDLVAIYKRHPLSDAIATRVLQIVPSELPDTPELIPCRLSIVLLDRPPEHQAVAYLWGDPAITRMILVNDLRYDVKVNLSYRCVGEAQRSSTWRWQERSGFKGEERAIRPRTVSL